MRQSLSAECIRAALFAAVTLASGILVSAAALAQSAPCTLTPDPKNAGAMTMHCGLGVNVRASRGASLAPIQAPGQAASGAELDSGAALIEFKPGESKTFQILTPTAIAAVRGTRWAVEITDRGTSVLTLTGAVAVFRRGASDSTLLHAGEGVDVDRGGGPLTTKRWPKERVRALLSRFGE